MTPRPASLRPRLDRRGLVIALHWLVAFLLLAMLKGGTGAPGVRWSFALAGGLWVAMALLRGLAGRPGPKLAGAARAVWRPMHWGLYGLVALSAGLNAGELLGLVPPGPAWTSLLVLLAAGSFHGFYHLWRHTALRDNALRAILPRWLHHIL